MEEVQLRVTQLEKSLREASKAREQRLRRAPIDARAMMAFEMQDMDQEVLALGRELALCTLDVQLDYLYVALEDELRQVLDAAVPAGLGRGEAAWAAVAGQTGLKKLAPRRGSTEELSVLLAQYALLARRQAALRDVMQARPPPALVPHVQQPFAPGPAWCSTREVGPEGGHACRGRRRCRC